MTVFKGCAVALVTPFLPDGRADFKRYEEIIEWQISEGIDAIVTCGTTGEASTLNDIEHLEIIKFCVDTVAKRVPVIGGAGSNDTRYGANLARRIEQVGVDALLLVTPYYNRCSQSGLIKHYHTLIESLSLPCILYSVPARTRVNIEPGTVAELAKHPRIVGIKEASGDISQAAEIARLVPDDFAIYSGNDDMVVPMMSLGAIGYISVLANVAPRDSALMSKKYLEGDFEGALKLQLGMKPLIDALFADVNPIPAKAALHMMGRCGMNYRKPLCPPNDEVMARIKKELTDYGLI